MRVIQEKIATKEYKSIEDLTGEIEKRPELRRLNFMLSKKNFYELGKDGCFRIESMLQQELENMSSRDTMLRIGGLSPDFSLCRFMSSQKSFRKLINNISPEAIDALDTCFIETPSTRKIIFMKWPKDINLLTFMSETTDISEGTLEIQIRESYDRTWTGKFQGLCGRNINMVLRPVSVKVLDMSWFF